MPFHGVGLGLRRPHLEEVAALPAAPVPFWEFAPENVVGQGGRRARQTREILTRDPALTHGLSLSIGGPDDWDPEQVRDLKAFLREVDAPWHSEHLCWTTFGGATTHELLPLPFTREAVARASARARELQDRLEVPFLLENISWYATLGAPEMDERTFLTEVLEGADCGWLLDLNNVYVNSVNHGFNPKAWLTGMPLHRVRQMHLAGHDWIEADQLLLDTHGAPVIDPVVELMQWILPRLREATGRAVPVLLERDNAIPPLAELLAERAHLQAAYDAALAAAPVNP